MPATYKDIQRLTGLSLSTISKYFNGGSIREENRRKIELAAGKLDFRVNELARGLKSRRSRTIGILIPELDSTFHTTIISDVEQVLRQHGYGVIVCDCRLDEAEEGEALAFLLDKMVDGIITIPYQKSGRHLELAAAHGVPVVLIDRLTEEYKADGVILDNAGASAQAVRAFAEYGHSEIAILSGPDGIYTMRERMAGFRREMERRGIPVREDYCLSVEMTVEGGYQGAKRLLSGPSRPTAVYCANYEITLGCVIAINELEISVPGDVSVVGFDNLMLSRIVKPRYAVIAQPMQEIAQAAARLMLEHLNGEAVGIRIVELPADFLPGKSISAPRTG